MFAFASLRREGERERTLYRVPVLGVNFSLYAVYVILYYFLYYAVELRRPPQPMRAPHLINPVNMP